jgi:hypothetical protein
MTHKCKWNPIGNLRLFGKLRKRQKLGGDEDNTSNDEANKENVRMNLK